MALQFTGLAGLPVPAVCPLGSLPEAASAAIVPAIDIDRMKADNAQNILFIPLQKINIKSLHHWPAIRPAGYRLQR